MSLNSLCIYLLLFSLFYVPAVVAGGERGAAAPANGSTGGPGARSVLPDPAATLPSRVPALLAGPAAAAQESTQVGLVLSFFVNSGFEKWIKMAKICNEKDS